MSRLLPHPPVRAERQLLTETAIRLPAEVRELIASERAAAYAQGHADGLAEAARAELDAAGAAATALRSAVDEAVARLREARDRDVAELLDLARDIAAYVVDAVDTSAVDAVVRRIRTALEQLDDTELVAHVHAGQAEAIATALAGTPVEVTADPTVAAGDARLVGRWSVADLGVAQRWSAVREVLDAGA